MSVILLLPSLAGPPLANDPGRIGLALVDKEGDEAAVEALVIMDGSIEDSTTFKVAVTDYKRSAERPLEVVIYACGRIRDRLLVQEVNGGRILEWKSLAGAVIDQDSNLGIRADCQYAYSSGSPHQVLLAGTSGAPIASRAGDRVLYSLPGLTTILTDEPLGLDMVKPLPRESTLSVALIKPRSDLSVESAVPQIPESGHLTWHIPANGGASIPDHYIISGSLISVQSHIQASVFVAGALIGIAGAAILWLAELAIDRSLQ